MDRPLVEFRWLRRLLAATALLWSFWITCAAVNYFGHRNQPGIHVYYPFYIFFVVMIIWTAAAAFLKPQAAAIAQAAAPARQPVPAELRAKGSLLKRAMETHLYYQDPELSLGSLAGKLHLHPHELSRVINTVFKKNFNDFVNGYRVREVAVNMQDPAYGHMTLLGIAYEAGFNSQTSFNRIFKQLAGKSPLEYRNSLKKEQPTYHLGNQAPVAAVISNPQTTRKWDEVTLNRNIMFKNYVKIAWRNLTGNKAFSLINISGLATGLACSLLIFLWVQDERHVDSFSANKNIYAVYERVFSDGKVEAGTETPGLLATELKRNIPGIKYASAFWNTDDETLFSVGDKNISVKGCHADSDFFKMFSYPLLEGTPASALSGPTAIAVSKTMAENFFGSPAAALGKTVRYHNWSTEDFKVTAVFDVPANASQKFDYVLNWSHQLTSIGWLREWVYRSPETFIQLEPGTDAAATQALIKNFITPYLSTGNGAGFRLELGLQRFEDMYLNATFRNGVPDGGRIEYVRLFTVIAVFILLIACINFMNLATARSVKRAKEVGIRKAVGALRTTLFAQFVGEAMILTFFAVIFALALVFMSLPYFNALTGKAIGFPLASPSFWLAIFALLCLTGLVAGSYPALFLSSLNPVKVLKGSLKFSPGALLFRKTLVVFQFVISIVLITGTAVISQQVHYVQHKNLGFDKEDLVYIPFQGNLGGKFELFRQQLSAMPGIKGVTMNTEPPSQIGAHVYNLEWEGKSPDDKVVVIHNGVGYDYLGMLHIPIVKGRGFGRDFPSDTAKTHFIINETLAKMTGFKDPIGKRLSFFSYSGTIIGVAKDFHLASLHEPIQPLVMYWGEHEGWGSALVKTQAGQARQAVASMAKIFRQLEPGFSFRYYFADAEYQKLYSSEMTVSELSDCFSFFAIFISCLGLLGLTMFTVEQRRKEIGVRKVIGANTGDIVTMLSKDIMKLVLLSASIATPVAWLAMDSWLQNFAYRIGIGWWIFLAAGMAALLIALATISWQTFKAAMANPVKSLRSE